MKRLASFLGCLSVLFAPVDVRGAAAPVPDSEAVRELTVRCAAGKLDAAFLAAFHAVIIERVKRSAFQEGLTDDFWDWLQAHPELREAALLAVAQGGSKVASNLDALRRKHDQAVLSHPSLAVAFAAAWSADGKTAKPRRYWVDGWVLNGREVPTMSDSFLWFVENSNRMRVSMTTTPWPLLTHLADSFTPLAEREWAQTKFGSRKTSGLRDLFAAVPYKLDPKRKEPCTLESFLRLGGPCTHNVQFADGVFDSFGIPSGWAGGPGHTYPYWFEEREKPKGYVFHRINELGNRDGTIRNPRGGDEIHEDDLRLLAAASSFSERARSFAVAAAWSFEHLPKDAPIECEAILITGIRANPFTTEAGNALARATAGRRISRSAAGTTWLQIAGFLQHHPDRLVSWLEKALPPSAKPGKPAPEPTLTGERGLLDAVALACTKDKRTELLPKVQRLRERCQEARQAESKNPN
ncbi:MAG: hypothetical protein RL514_2122 [Verrucomicrobiota bacterium]|jgi:hypothetical protein